MAPNQSAFTTQLVKQIQDINGNPAYSPQEKRAAIAALSGAPQSEMMDYLNKNFRTGPGLSKYVAKFVSKDRPRGAPSEGPIGTKKVKTK